MERSSPGMEIADYQHLKVFLQIPAKVNDYLKIYISLRNDKNC